MLLQLDDRFRITCDSSKQNYQLEALQSIRDRKTKEFTGQTSWIVAGFHGNSIKSVLNQYVKESLIISEPSTLQQILDKLNELNKTIDMVVRRENIRLDVKADD